MRQRPEVLLRQFCAAIRARVCSQLLILEPAVGRDRDAMVYVDDVTVGSADTQALGSMGCQAAGRSGRAQ